MNLPDHIEEGLDSEFTGSLDSYAEHNSALSGSEYDETGTTREPNYYWVKAQDI
jgi:hypothetical protein